MFAALLPATIFAQWSTDPTQNNAICTAFAFDHTAPVVASDAAGGAIAAWVDDRDGQNIFVQRISKSGTVQWSANGVPLAFTNPDYSPAIISDGSGGAIIAWQGFGTGTDIFAQRIDASGNAQWTEGGVTVCSASGNQFLPELVSDGSGGAIITWYDLRNGIDNDIYAQRVDAAGTIQWTANGVAVCTASGDQFNPTIASDDAGGAIITWYDGRSGIHIFAQRINASGSALWTANGVTICAAAASQYTPLITEDNAGGAIITWFDQRNLNWDIFAQRVNSSGTVLWTTDGVAICVDPNNQYLGGLVADGSSGAIITWEDDRSGNADIYAQRIDATGSVQWTANGVALCAAVGDQTVPRMTTDGTGGAIVAWQDGRAGNKDVYAQRITTAGAVQWVADGARICTASNDQTVPVIVSDGTGGAEISWQDGRSGTEQDIYAQRVDRLGNLYPAPWIDKVGDIANDQGGKLDILWKASNLDSWASSSVKSYTVKMGVKTTGVLGKIDQIAGDGIYWRTAGSVSADWSDGYSMVISTNADSGLQGIPYYYFQVIAKNADSTILWTSNVDSGFSVDNIPPVGLSGGSIASPENGGLLLSWNKDRVDPDVLGYEVYRSQTSGFALDSSSELALSFDTTYTDASAIPGQTYYYRVATEDVHGNVGLPTEELSETALSTTLTSFLASSSRLSADLRWTTSTETDIDRFEIERATVDQGPSHSSPWASIGSLAGSGTSTSSKDYEYIDRNVVAGTYDYRIKTVQRNGSFAYSKTIEIRVGDAPKEFTLSQNYPNPFNPTTSVEFTVPEDGRVQLRVFNALGEEVAVLLDQLENAGEYHRVSFDASHLGSGVYFVRIQFGGSQLVKKMLLLK